MSKFIYGIHDPGGEHLLDGRGWIMFTETADGQPGDYRHYADQGYGVIVRLNNGYSPAGTIPAPDRYAEFAQRCAAWVAASRGVEWLTIGNEIAHHHEWPTDQPIPLASYLDCYRQVYAAIKNVAPHVKIAPQAVAPWNASTPDAPDWILQLRHMLLALGNKVDWINLHAYTRTYTAGCFTTGGRMDAPWNSRYSGWETLHEFMSAIPATMRHLPVMVTEANGNASWSQYRQGWVQELYQQIENWNAPPPDNKPLRQQIRAAILFRWAPHDTQWDMSQCSQAHDDLRAAVAAGYQWRDVQPQVLPSPQWTGYVTASPHLRLRAEPNTSAAVLAEVPTGARVAVSGERDGWLQVAYNGLSGWMAKTWVSQDAPTINGGSTVDQRSAIIAKLAAEYGVDERLAKAVIKIESGGSGFRNGRLIIRFEPHVFKAQLEKIFQGVFAVGSPAWNGDQHRHNGQPFHGNQDAEYRALEDAIAQATEAAYQSASYGAGQILGINHASVGYLSAKAMMDAFQQSEEAQLRAMFEYMRSRGLIEELRAGDLLAFASAYNGPANATHYEKLIREAMQ